MQGRLHRLICTKNLKACTTAKWGCRKMDAAHASALLKFSVQGSCGTAESFWKLPSRTSSSFRDASPQHSRNSSSWDSSTHRAHSSLADSSRRSRILAPNGTLGLQLGSFGHPSVTEVVPGSGANANPRRGMWSSSPCAQQTLTVETDSRQGTRWAKTERTALDNSPNMAARPSEQSFSKKQHNEKQTRLFNESWHKGQVQSSAVENGSSIRNVDKNESMRVSDAAATQPPNAEEDSSHLPLNLKFRPKKFKELVGQESVKWLEKAVQANKVSPAYLFSGPRGTGKTSAARILAASLNCTSGSKSKEPCGQCEQCRLIGKENPAVREIDGASYNGVDSIREVLESIRYAVLAKYKVYIIDECHMLSQEAANLLLKKVEEPPPGVRFILVTTEQQRLPPALVSRCQKIRFEKVKVPDMVERMRQHAEKENIKVEPDALQLIASHADGSVRDAEMMLERARLFDTHAAITAARIEELEGLPSKALMQTLLEDMLTPDKSPAVMATTVKLLDNGISPLTILEQLADLICNLIEGGSKLRVGNLQKVATDEALHSLQRDLVTAEERVRSASARDLWLKMNLCAISQSSAGATNISSKTEAVSEPSSSGQKKEVNSTANKHSAQLTVGNDLVSAADVPGGPILPQLKEAEPEKRTLETVNIDKISKGTSQPVTPPASSADPAAPPKAITQPEPANPGSATDNLLEPKPEDATTSEVFQGADSGPVEAEAPGGADDGQGKEEDLDEQFKLVIAAVVAKTVRALLEQQGWLKSLTKEEAVIGFKTESHCNRAKRGRKGITAAFKDALQRELEVSFVVDAQHRKPPNKPARGDASDKAAPAAKADKKIESKRAEKIAVERKEADLAANSGTEEVLRDSVAEEGSAPPVSASPPEDQWAVLAETTENKTKSKQKMSSGEKGGPATKVTVPAEGEDDRGSVEHRSLSGAVNPVSQRGSVGTGAYKTEGPKRRLSVKEMVARVERFMGL
eukprot:TRINITY_DN16628_c0_g4_i1.p1 TRINITY_DN16628_c0_g4~~TRINITY_DN16628_c0_g4_i1.p1  ORF type:complete len:978 (-),score=195.46 TRINITY_DN16628_c0_g4_i1:367-3300(-)